VASMHARCLAGGLLNRPAGGRRFFRFGATDCDTSGIEAALRLDQKIAITSNGATVTDDPCQRPVNGCGFAAGLDWSNARLALVRRTALLGTLGGRDNSIPLANSSGPKPQVRLRVCAKRANFCLHHPSFDPVNVCNRRSRHPDSPVRISARKVPQNERSSMLLK
jgi:hypothetical protein